MTEGAGGGNVWEQAVLTEDGRFRAGPRITIFFALFFLFFFTGQYAVSVLPSRMLEWVAPIVMTAAAVAAGLIGAVRLDRRLAASLGFPLRRVALRDTLDGTLVGGALIGAVFLLFLLTRSTYFEPDAGTVADYILTLLSTLGYFWLAAAAEEALFRGYPFQVLVESLGPWPGMILSSAVFSWAHAQNPNVGPIAFLNIFLAGVLLAAAFLRTRSLWFATAVHLGWNWVMATLLDFPVSGLTTFDTPLYSAVENGVDWWTGGDFGPEAGVACTIVLLVGTAWLVRSTDTARPGPTVAASRPQ